VRRRIVDGRWEPGQRIPSRAKLLERFGVNSPTLQRAMDQLKEDGFIHTRGRHGTFVADYPPHLYRIGLAFAPERHDPSWSTMWEALLAAAEQVAAEGPFRFEAYLGVDSPMDTEGAWRLQRDIGRGALAGVVLDDCSINAYGDLGLKGGSIPAIGITTAKRDLPVPSMSTHYKAFTGAALAHLHAAGCRRIAMLVLGNAASWDRIRSIERAYAKCHVPFDLKWVQGVPVSTSEWASHTAQLLVAGPASQRPDGLIIADDNLTVHAAKGLAEAGIAVPDDLHIVSLGNWPRLPEMDIPVTWLGFDHCARMRNCLDLLTRLRAGKPVPNAHLLPLVNLSARVALD